MLIGISVRRWQENSRDFEKSVAAACDYISQKYGYYPVFVPMQKEKDTAISKNIMRMMKVKSSIIDKDLSVEEMMSIFKCMDMCIGMRLHSLIYSAAQSVPLIGLSYDPKIVSFMEYTHQNFCIDVRDINKEKLIKMIDECMENYDEIREDLKNHCEYLKEHAHKNGELAAQLYEKQ